MCYQGAWVSYSKDLQIEGRRTSKTQLGVVESRVDAFHAVRAAQVEVEPLSHGSCSVGLHMGAVDGHTSDAQGAYGCLVTEERTWAEVTARMTT